MVYEQWPNGTVTLVETAIPNGTLYRSRPADGTQGPRYVYSLTDHLGNVRAVVPRGWNPTNTAAPEWMRRLSFYSDYYPFGWAQPGRDGGQYRYGFQGQEKDPETDWWAFQLRMYDGRIGRWMTVDPKAQYANPYLGLGNNPFNGVDPDGGFFGKLFSSLFGGGGGPKEQVGASKLPDVVITAERVPIERQIAARQAMGEPLNDEQQRHVNSRLNYESYRWRMDQHDSKQVLGFSLAIAFPTSTIGAVPSWVGYEFGFFKRFGSTGGTALYSTGSGGLGYNVGISANASYQAFTGDGSPSLAALGGDGDQLSLGYSAPNGLGVTINRIRALSAPAHLPNSKALFVGGELGISIGLPHSLLNTPFRTTGGYGYTNTHIFSPWGGN